jgi:hypothetical protein
VAERVGAMKAPEPGQAATVTAPEQTTAEAAKPTEERRVPGTSPWAAPPRQAHR